MENPANHSQRWLLLDQETDVLSWISPDRNDLLDCIGVDWGGCKHEFSPVERHRPLMAGEVSRICILFLPEKSTELESFFSQFDPVEWKLWCHYGGDINMKRVPRRWSGYSRLNDEDKKRICPSQQYLPQPYSLNMRELQWSDLFNQLRRYFLEQSKGSDPDISPFRFDESLRILSKAWGLAGGEVALWERHQQANAQLLGYVVARHMDEQCSQIWDARSYLVCMTDIYRNFREVMLQDRDHYSEDVGSAFDQFSDALTKTKLLLQMTATEMQIRSQAIRLHQSLKLLIRSASSHADNLSSALATSPAMRSMHFF